MIFLDFLYNLPNSTSGMDTIAVETITAIPAFTYLTLLFVFFVVFLGGISRQKLRSGFADYPAWCVVASIATFIISLLMSVVNGIIRLDTLVIVVVITIFSGIWLFLDRKASEI